MAKRKSKDQSLSELIGGKKPRGPAPSGGKHFQPGFDSLPSGGIQRMASAAPRGDPFGGLGNLSPGTRIKRGRDGTPREDDPGWKRKKPARTPKGRSLGWDDYPQST